MIHVDYTQLGQPPYHLVLERESDQYWIVIAQPGSDTVMIRSGNPLTCEMFMRAFVAKTPGASLDAWSVSQACSSVRVPALDGAEATPVWDDGNSAPSNVVALKVCKDCGDRYISWGAHAERCFGRPAKAKP